MARNRNSAKAEVVRSSGNVFADLGLPGAPERPTKARLAATINQILQRRQLSQVEAARQLGVNRPKISALARYRLEVFSVERSMQFLTALDQDIEIVVHRKPQSRRAARISVIAA